MGYHTEFRGQFYLDKELEKKHADYLHKFNDVRHMERDPAIAEDNFEDPLRVAVDLPIGKEGRFFVDATGHSGQDSDESILDYNKAPEGCPGLWCQWRPTEDGKGIEWDEGEKFYEYVAWLEFIIEHFLKPWGYVLSGDIDWNGEEGGDHGCIYVEDNKVEAVDDVNPGPSWAPK